MDGIMLEIDIGNYMKTLEDLDKKILSLFMSGYTECEIITMIDISKSRMSKFKRRFRMFLNQRSE